MEEDIVRQINEVKDTHRRLELAETVVQYFSKDDWTHKNIKDFRNLIGGLANWIKSSSLQVSTTAMKIVGIIAAKMKRSFHGYISIVLDQLMNRLGDGKVQVQESAQVLIAILLKESVGKPYELMNRIMEISSVHRNWRVKEQGLHCLLNAINEYGTDKICVSEFISRICTLTSDGSGQVRSAAMDTLVEVHSRLGSKLHTLMRKSRISPVRVKTLMKSVESVAKKSQRGKKVSRTSNSSSVNSDTKTGNGHDSEMASSDVALRASSIEQHGQSSTVREASYNCSGSTSSLSTFRSVTSVQRRHSMPLIPRDNHSISYLSHSHSSFSSHKMASKGTLQKRMGANSSVSSLSCCSSFQGIGIQDFENEFSDVVEIKFQNYHNLDKSLNDISKVLVNTEVPWDIRANALKEFRGIILGSHNTVNKQEFKVLIKDMEVGLTTSLKDPRSQVIKEACITISYLSRVLKHYVSSLGVKIIPTLISLLVKPVRIIANSAEICTRYIIQNSPSSQLLNCLLTHGFPSKSFLVRRHAAKFMIDIVTNYEIKLLSNVHLVHDTLLLAIRDADEAARKFGRGAFLEYQRRLPTEANLLLKSFTQQEQKYIREDKAQHKHSTSEQNSCTVSALTTVSKKESRSQKCSTRTPHLASEKYIASQRSGMDSPSKLNKHEECKMVKSLSNKQVPPSQPITLERFKKSSKIDKSHTNMVSTKDSLTCQSTNKKLQQSTENLHCAKEVQQEETAEVPTEPLPSPGNHESIEASTVASNITLSNIMLDKSGEEKTVQLTEDSKQTSEQKNTQKNKVGVQKTCSRRDVWIQAGSGLISDSNKNTKTQKNIQKIEEILEDFVQHHKINDTTKSYNSQGIPRQTNSNAASYEDTQSWSKRNHSKDHEPHLYSMLQRLQCSEMIEAFETALDQAINNFLERKGKTNENHTSPCSGGTLPQASFATSRNELDEGTTVSIAPNKLSTISPGPSSVFSGSSGVISQPMCARVTTDLNTSNSSMNAELCASSNATHPSATTEILAADVLSKTSTTTIPCNTLIKKPSTDSVSDKNNHPAISKPGLASSTNAAQPTSAVLQTSCTVSYQPTVLNTSLSDQTLIPHGVSSPIQSETYPRKNSHTVLPHMQDISTGLSPTSHHKKVRIGSVTMLPSHDCRSAVSKEIILDNTQYMSKTTPSTEFMSKNGTLENNVIWRKIIPPTHWQGRTSLGRKQKSAEEIWSPTKKLCQVDRFLPATSAEFLPEQSCVSIFNKTRNYPPYSQDNLKPLSKQSTQEDLDVETESPWKSLTEPATERNCSQTPRLRKIRTLNPAKLPESQEHSIHGTQNIISSQTTRIRGGNSSLLYNTPPNTAITTEFDMNRNSTALPQQGLDGKVMQKSELQEIISKYITNVPHESLLAKTRELKEEESPKEMAIRFLKKAEEYYKLRKKRFRS